MASGSLFSAYIDLAVRGKSTALAQMSTVEGAAGKMEKNVGSKMTSMGGKMKSVGGSLTKFVSLPLAAAGGAAVKFAADYDQALTNAVSVTGKTGKAAVQATKDMDSLAKKMGKETAFSAKEAADAMYDLASSGWDAQDMGKGLRGIMDLAAATQSDLASTTETVTATLGQFGLEAQDSGRISDVFTKAIGSSKANMDRLSQSMKTVGPVANALGYSVEDTTAILSKLYDAGFEGEQAGTALRGALSSLMNPVGQTKEGLNALGVSMDEVNPKTNSFTDILRTLKAAGMDASTATQIFGREAAPAMLAVSNKAGGIDKLAKSLNNAGGTAKRVADQQLNTLSGQLKILGGSLQTAAITVGQKFLPALKGITSFLVPLVNRFTALPAPVMAAVLGFAGLAAAIGPLLFIVGTLFTTLGPLVAAIGGAGGLSTALGIAGGAVGSFIVAALPFVAVALGIAAAGIAVYKNWDKIKAAFQPLMPIINQVKAAFNSLKTVIGGLINGNSGTLAFRKAFASLPGPIQSAIKIIVVAWRGLKTAFSQAKAAILPILKQIGNGIKTGLVTAFKFLLGQGRQLVAWFKANWPQIKATVVPVIRFIGRIIRTVLVQAFKFALANARLVVNWFRKNWPLIKQTVVTVFNAIKRVVGAVMRVVWNGIIKPIVGAIVRFWKQNWDSVKAILQSVWNIIKSVVKTAIKNVLNIIKLVMQVITGDWKGAWKTIKTILSDNWKNIKTIIKEALKIVWNIIKQAWQNIKDLTRRAWDRVKGVIERRTRGVREWISGWRDRLKNIMVDLKDSIWDAMKSIGKALWKPIQDGWSKAKEIWNSIIDAIAGVADKFGLDSITKSLKGAKFGGGGGNAPASPAQERAKGGIDYAAKGGDFRRPRQPKLIEYGEGPSDEAAIFVSKDRRHRRDNEKYTGVAANMLGGRFIPEGQLREPSRYGEAFARGGLYKGKSDRAEMRRSGGYAEDHPTHYNIRSGVKSRVDEVNANTGGDYWNTYYGHPGGDANSVDWWGGGGRGAPVGTSTGTGIANYITDKLWKGLNWIIWNRQINSGGGWAPHTGPFDHTDHVHATWQDNGGGFGGSMGGASGGGGVLGAITNPVATFWDKTIQPMADKFTGALGKGNIMNQVLAGAGKDLVGGLREKVVGSGGSGGVGGPISGSQAEVAKQFAAGAEGRGIPGPLPVMTALVESGMKNLNYGDRDSVGYFQQRPSQGWGTPEQLQDPAYALDAFLDVAEQYKGQYGNDASSLGAWAQAVQRSAFPDRYAQEYGRAKELIGYADGGLVKKEHQAILHPNELALPLNHPRTAPLLQSMAGTDRLEKELQETRRVLNETLVRQEEQMTKVKEWAGAMEATTRSTIGSGRADSELGNYMLKTLD